METKTIVKYVSYAVGAIALIGLLKVALVPALALAACAAVNILYVGRD